LDPAVTVVEREAVYPSGESDRQEQERAISQMDQSKLDAAAVVLGQLTDYPREHGRGVLVESVVPGCAADGKLFVGDVIEAIDGVAVDTMRDARRVIRAAPSGTSLRFDVTVDGEPERVSLVREPCGGESEPLVGISMIASFPFEVTISSGAIGGPSAGLAWALGFYDLLTPGDLTDGRTIATTGALGADGTVYPIGGVEEKVVAAERAGASVLLVPERNLAAAQAVGADGLEIVGVGSFHDALAQLEDD
jgi:PDZ domain-containing protein